MIWLLLINGIIIFLIIAILLAIYIIKLKYEKAEVYYELFFYYLLFMSIPMTLMAVGLTLGELSLNEVQTELDITIEALLGIYILITSLTISIVFYVLNEKAWLKEEETKLWVPQ